MYILFDIGGTKMRLAGSQDGETFDTPIKVETPKDDFEAGVRLFVETAKEIAGSEPIEAVAGGLAGPLDAGKTMLVNAPNIPGWNNQPFRERIAQELECSVYIENDTAVVGLGEATVGAGKDSEIVVYMTVSTGVGGVRIVQKTIDANRYGFEIGHHIVNMDEVDVLCPTCPERGHIESYISGTAFERKFGKKAFEVSQDDPVWDSAAQQLAVALNNVAVFWSPDIIVLGGSMIVGDPAIPLDRIEGYFKQVLKIFPEHPKLVKAALGDDGGLHGALAYLKQAISNKK